MKTIGNKSTNCDVGTNYYKINMNDRHINTNNKNAERDNNNKIHENIINDENVFVDTTHNGNSDVNSEELGIRSEYK